MHKKVPGEARYCCRVHVPMLRVKIVTFASNPENALENFNRGDFRTTIAAEEMGDLTIPLTAKERTRARKEAARAARRLSKVGDVERC